MSVINRHIPIAVKAYAEAFVRASDGFEIMSPVHPWHPMREMATIRVNSLRDMWFAAPIGIDIPSQNAEVDALAYGTGTSDVPKPVLTIRTEIEDGSVIRIAATTTVPEELALVEGALDVVRGLLWRRVDASEAILWFYTLGRFSATLTPTQTVSSFRELFALARTFLSRMAPNFAFKALMRPLAYGAAILENSAGVAQNSNYTELQDASGSMIIVPIAAEYFIGSLEPVIVYPSWLTSLCKRYIYDAEFVDRVVDEATERNVHRVTCERYMTPVLPYFFYYEAENKFIVPSVAIDASNAINEIASRYGADALNNLQYAAQTS
jgi:hypothetical protein